MILERSMVIFFHSKTHLKQKRHEFHINQSTKYEEVAEKVKELYKITENKFDMMVKQDNREIVLTDENFQLFKKTVHLNKIIKIEEYDVLNLTYIDTSGKRQRVLEKEVTISETDLQPINEGKFISDYSSFLADDFHQMIPLLQEMCTINSEVRYNQHEQLGLKLIEQVSSAIRPALESFYSKQENMNRLKLK